MINSINNSSNTGTGSRDSNSNNNENYKQTQMKGSNISNKTGVFNKRRATQARTTSAAVRTMRRRLSAPKCGPSKTRRLSARRTADSSFFGANGVVEVAWFMLEGHGALNFPPDGSLNSICAPGETSSFDRGPHAFQTFPGILGFGRKATK